MTKKILITGGSGFIGRNLKEGLADTYDIRAPSSSELNLLDADQVKKYLKEHSFDVVIHSATHDASRNSDKDVNLVFENNLRMFFNLAHCSDMYGKMFYFGSGAEYDKANYTPDMKEEYFGTHIPKNQYGFSKYIMSKYTETADNIYDLRIFGCFGPYEDWEIRFISNAICKAVHGLPVTIKQNIFFDYMYVQDLTRIMDWFISRDTLAHKQYNVCTGTKVDLATLAKKVIKASNKDLSIQIAEEGLKPEYTGNNERLMQEMGGFEFTPIDQAVSELYDWYNTRASEIDKSLLMSDK